MLYLGLKNKYMKGLWNGYLWRKDKILLSLSLLIRDRTYVVLLATGSFNPPTFMHLRMFGKLSRFMVVLIFFPCSRLQSMQLDIVLAVCLSCISFYGAEYLCGENAQNQLFEILNFIFFYVPPSSFHIVICKNQ